MTSENDWRAEVRLSAAEAALVVDVDAADVMTEMILWVMLRARKGCFDLLGSHRRRVRTQGWRFFASSRILPPLMVDYEVSPVEHLVTFCGVTLLRSNRISAGTPAEEASLPSALARQALLEEAIEGGHEWAFLEFVDAPRSGRYRERDRRAWSICVAPTYEVLGPARLPGDVQQALYFLMLHIAMNVDRVNDESDELLSAELPLASDEKASRLAVTYRLDRSARRATIIDIAIRTD